MYKILFMISQFHKGGAETSLLTLLKKMDPKQYDVDFIIMNQVHVEGAVSLVEQIPPYIHVFNVLEEEQRQNFLARKVYFKLIKGELYSEMAIRFVNGKEYDLAIHVGEWWTPEFMATFVHAKRKVVWFHADIDKSNVFSSDKFFASDGVIDYYLFVSQHSMDSSCSKYPFIKDRSYVLHNCIDVDEIVRKGNEPSPIRHDGKRPLVVTVANIRTEKNHLRALEAMRLLKNEGLRFTWWNVGHESVPEIAQKLRDTAVKEGLDKDFILTGADDNPYPLVKQADALACLSDFESWSLVITEARCLGVPIVATKTSGAIEQVTDNGNGVLVDFSAESIAEGLKKILFNKAFNAHCREYLHMQDKLPDPLQELRQILELPEHQSISKSILYVIDDVNYRGGAHRAAFFHIRVLQKNGFDVSIYSPTVPELRVRLELPGVHFYNFFVSREYAFLTRRSLGCILAKDMTAAEKRKRMELLRSFRENRDLRYIDMVQDQYLQELASQFDVVCLLSEGSRFKKAVCESTPKKKIQWIHTDYCTWNQLNDYALNLSKDDGELWKNMDQIVVLSPKFEKTLAKMYPHLKEKITSVGNIQPADEICELASKKTSSHLNVACILGGTNPEIEGRGILDALLRRKKQNNSFYWVIVGLPFEVMNDYPLLNNSVTCVPSIAVVDPEILLQNKDLLVTYQEENAIVQSAKQIQLPITYVSDNVSDMKKTDDGWVIPSNNQTVSFVWDNAVSIISKNVDRKYLSQSKMEQHSEEKQKPVHFVSCFRFEPVKNVEGIIRTLGRLHVCGIKFCWTFVGDGEQYALAQEMVKWYHLEQQVSFVGEQTNPYPFIQQSDVFVQFSKYEGLPNTIFEALILGVPVLATNVGAISDQITSWEHGWLIENSENALASAIINIISQPKKLEQMKAALKQYQYDNKKVEKQLINVFTV